MSRYNAIGKRLATVDGDTVTIAFDEFERLIGGPLPIVLVNILLGGLTLAATFPTVGRTNGCTTDGRQLASMSMTRPSHFVASYPAGPLPLRRFRRILMIHHQIGASQLFTAFFVIHNLLETSSVSTISNVKYAALP